MSGMKTIPAALAIALLARACGGEPDPAPPSAAAPPPPAATALAMNAMHGGSVLLVEDQYVEVVPKTDGTIEAYVLGPSAPSAVVTAPSNMTVKITGDDGAQHDVPLVWSPTSSRFEGRLVEARPAPGPVEVVVIAPGRPPRRARAPQVIVVAAPPPAVVVAAPPPPAVVVAPPRPTVVVAQPAPPTVVVAPPAPPGVVVVPPAPGVVVVERDDHHHRDRGRHRGHDRHDGVVVVGPSHPTVVVAPPRPGVVVVGPRPGAVVIGPGRGGGGHGHGGRRGGRDRDRDD